MKNKNFKVIIAVVVMLLLIPLVAMQFTDQVVWTGMDFAVMGGLLLGVGLLVDLVLRKMTTFSRKVILIIAIVLIFLLVWAELAVGIIGMPFAGS